MLPASRETFILQLFIIYVCSWLYDQCMCLWMLSVLVFSCCLVLISHSCSLVVLFYQLTEELQERGASGEIRELVRLLSKPHVKVRVHKHAHTQSHTHLLVDKTCHQFVNICHQPSACHIIYTSLQSMISVNRLDTFFIISCPKGDAGIL